MADVNDLVAADVPAPTKETERGELPCSVSSLATAAQHTVLTIVGRWNFVGLKSFTRRDLANAYSR